MGKEMFAWSVLLVTGLLLGGWGHGLAAQDQNMGSDKVAISGPALQVHPDGTGCQTKDEKSYAPYLNLIGVPGMVADLRTSRRAFEEGILKSMTSGQTETGNLDGRSGSAPWENGIKLDAPIFNDKGVSCSGGKGDGGSP